MIQLLLFWTFFKIGLFSFGGGYAMIPLIQTEIERNGWIGAKEYADIIAISQMTPGPLAVNAATYVGAKTAGILGSFSATLGVSLPSFILIVIIAHFFIQFKENAIIESILQGIRPVTIGMVGSAVVFMAGTSIFKSGISFIEIKSLLTGQLSNSDNIIDVWSIAVFLIILISTVKFKVHPILAVVLSAVLGMVPLIISTLWGGLT
ncbi:chromate transporter [Acetivibrio cellulolyticus]|uniref:chromate transporter n=1 Tax=Acetivibrio cellulolyticus TaxID=35830 RepID=UPI0001E2E76C|nr:chromate transporter [Acetivibrio cellulolyticus]